MYKVYLSLGTNLGNRKRNIREAIDKIGEQIGVVKRQSALLFYLLPHEYCAFYCPNSFRDLNILYTYLFTLLRKLWITQSKPCISAT